jgi:hypothetical protein
LNALKFRDIRRLATAGGIKMMRRPFTVVLWLCLVSSVDRSFAAEPKSAVADALSQKLLSPMIPMQEIKDFVDAHLLPMPEPKTVADWERYATRVRKEALDRVIFRGEAAKWRALPTRVEWQQTIDGGPGYKIKKLRYEAVPGLWIPALLYEPTEFKTSKVPVSLAVNGHERPGKALGYKQIRCINQAKRGMIVLNTEFLGFGQLNSPNFDHYRPNQLELCGISAVSPFYLVMSRGLDILLAHEHADPTRVAVQGLSGGAWQTITISSLDTRVTLCNPVAGYGPLPTRMRYLSDTGDPEQDPCDLATVTDYGQMTALLAPRPALLTNNYKDTCCFKADHILPPLLGMARPIYELYGKSNNLRTHVNLDPGTHNFGLDNRQQFYGMLKDFFFADRPDVNASEIPSDKEVKTPDQLNVPLPKNNADFNSLARGMMAPLPREKNLPSPRKELVDWQEKHRASLRQVVRARTLDAASVTIGTRKIDDYTATDYWFRVGGAWTIPATEFAPANSRGTAVVIADEGRVAATAAVEKLLRDGHRVVAVDLCFFGELQIPKRIDYIPADFMLALATVGERPLGVQAAQLVAIARWIAAQKGHPSQIVAVGPRSSLIATVAAALETSAISELDLHGSFGSLKEIIEQNLTAENAPELFCFGLLEHFDVAQLVALVAPRQVHFREPSARVRHEIGPVRETYAVLGIEFDPTQ